MSANFQPAAGLSEKAEKILTEFANSGSCESSGVADILNVIAENGDEMSEDATLINAAYEIIGSAHAFINRLTGYTKLVCPQCGSGDVKDAGSLFFERGNLMANITRKKVVPMFTVAKAVGTVLSRWGRKSKLSTRQE